MSCISTPETDVQERAATEQSKYRSVVDFHSIRELKNAMTTTKGNRYSHTTINKQAHYDAKNDNGDILNNVPYADLVDEEHSVGNTSTTSSIGMNDDPNLDWMITNADCRASTPQTIDQELARLQVLRSYMLLDAEKDPAIERITGLVSRMFNLPICVVSLVDLGRHWFVSSRGLGEFREYPRKTGFCAHAIISTEDLFIVPDLSKDERFKDYELVTGGANFQFYAGAPLISPEGYRLGALCVIDTKPHPDGLSLDEKQSLREFADLVVDAMVQRRSEKTYKEDKTSMIACTTHDLLTPLNGIQLSLDLLVQDDDIQQRLSEDQIDLMTTAGSCADIMKDICHQTIKNYRGVVSKQKISRRDSSSSILSVHSMYSDSPTVKTILIADLVTKIQTVIQHSSKSVPLYVSVDPEVPPAIVGNELKIFRAAMNYLTNACRLTKKGSILLKISVLTQESGKRMLVFECEDTGVGVPIEKQKYLFQPFNDGSQCAIGEVSECIKVDKTSGKAQGTGCHSLNNNYGLGLHSVAENVRSMNGEYGFKPRGQDARGEQHNNYDCNNETSSMGSIFWFSIPLEVQEDDGTVLSCESIHEGLESIHESLLDADDDTFYVRHRHEPEEEEETIYVQQQEEKPHCDLEPLEKENCPKAKTNTSTSTECGLPKPMNRVQKALVIDDSVVIRKSVSRALSKSGFEVTTAVNGMEGLKMLQSSIYDVVLCDFLMPIMDGLDCVKQFRDWEQSHRCPALHQHIVGISAHASENDIDRGLTAGMNSFQSKPITLKIINEILVDEESKQMSEKLDKEHASSSPSTNHDPASSSIQANRDDLVDHNTSSKVHNDHEGRVCLIAEDSPTVLKTLVRAIEKQGGWKISTVQNGEDALRLLKTRRWDAVFIDDDMPLLTGTHCIARFREWENENRVSRQKSVFLMSGNHLPSSSPLEEQRPSAVNPTGFDGSIGKPIRMNDIKFLLSVAGEASEKHELVLS